MASSAEHTPLQALRQLMQQAGAAGHLDAYIVPSEDSHQSEYVADCDRRRAFISKFTGSAGLALITMSKALLWTDGRYFLQASQQLSSEWELMRSGECLSLEDWLVKNLSAGARIGMDAECMSIDAAKSLNNALEKHGLQLVAVQKNLVDAVWEARPAQPSGLVLVQPLEFAGKSVVEKLAEIRGKLVEGKARALVVAALDEVAWLYNIRGSDVAYNPVVRAYAIVTLDAAFLYVDSAKISPEVATYVHQNSVELREYKDLMADIEALSLNQLHGSLQCPGAVTPAEGELLWIDPHTCSWAILQQLLKSVPMASVYLQPSPVALAKALKHEVELAGMRAAHLRDGAAMVEYLAWLDYQMQHQLGAAGYFAEKRETLKRKVKEEKLTEVSVATKLEEMRSKQQHFRGLSFPTISSVGPNAAVIHYIPDPLTCTELDPDQIYLCDSGAQYWDGTTDVTRTIHFGRPSAHEMACYTQVLKGHILLDQAVFPTGTTGHALDILARVPLWSSGLDYRHGTGHGVGSHLNVHEGPHLISFRPQARNVPLQANMTVTNEPGFYEDGNFGVRIENVMLVKEMACKHNFGNKGFLAFESITLVPLQVKLMDISMLTEVEKKWVDGYHAKCRRELSPILQGFELEWLINATKPLEASK